MFCRYCGKEIRNDAVYCPACGKKMPDFIAGTDAQTDDERYAGAAGADDARYDDAAFKDNGGFTGTMQPDNVRPGNAAQPDRKTKLIKGKLSCPACGSENLLEASYCFRCGRKFTEKEQQAAYNMTIYGKIEKAEMIKSIADGSIITGSTWFRVIVLVLIAAVGLWGLYKNGSNFRVAESDRYEVQYNTEEKEYYLLTDYDSINVALYVPKNTEQLELTAINTVTDEVVETKTYTVSDDMTLYPDSQVKYRISIGKRELTLYALHK